MNVTAAITWDDLKELWPHVTALGHLLVATLASGHVVLRKRDSRAAIGWAGLIWLSPFLGAALYWGFGINRIRRKAHAVRGQPYAKLQRATIVGGQQQPARTGVEKAALQPLATLVG